MDVLPWVGLGGFVTCKVHLIIHIDICAEEKNIRMMNVANDIIPCLYLTISSTQQAQHYNYNRHCYYSQH